MAACASSPSTQCATTSASSRTRPTRSPDGTATAPPVQRRRIDHPPRRWPVNGPVLRLYNGRHAQADHRLWPHPPGVHRADAGGPGTQPAGHPVPDQAWKLADWLDYWLGHVVTPNRRPATYRLYEMTARLYLKPGVEQHPAYPAIGIARPGLLQRRAGPGPIRPDSPGDEGGPLIGAVSRHA